MSESDSQTKPVLIPVPFKPRPMLFAAALLLFAAWVGFMIWMYVTTVYPTRHNGVSRPSVTATPAAEAP